MSGLVYRVENAKGIGMYYISSIAGEGLGHVMTDTGDTEIYYDTNEGGRHPAPRHDNKLDWSAFQDRHGPQSRFGFASIDQLMFWLYREEWRQGLKDRGFTLAVYEADEGAYSHGDTQAVFSKDRAMRITNIDLVDLVTQVDVEYA